MILKNLLGIKSILKLKGYKIHYYRTQKNTLKIYCVDLYGEIIFTIKYSIKYEYDIFFTELSIRKGNLSFGISIREHILENFKFMLNFLKIKEVEFQSEI